MFWKPCWSVSLIYWRVAFFIGCFCLYILAYILICCNVLILKFLIALFYVSNNALFHFFRELLCPPPPAISIDIAMTLNCALLFIIYWVSVYYAPKINTQFCCDLFCCGYITKSFELTGCKYLVSHGINTSPPSAVYMRQWIGSVSVQIMACRLVGAKPLSESMLE